MATGTPVQMRFRLIAAIFLVLIASMISAGKASAGDAFDQARRLARGVNVLCFDPIWKNPAAAQFQPRLFKVIREGGFRTVRVNLEAFAHMDSADRLNPQWLHTLDAVVNQATTAGLNVILDEHDFEACGADADGCSKKLLAFWSQVAPRYRKAPSSVLFEILNEPNGQLEANRWNGLLADVLAVIRRSNVTRTVVIWARQQQLF